MRHRDDDQRERYFLLQKPQHADSIVVARQITIVYIQNAIQCHLNSLFTLYFKFHYFIRSGTAYACIYCVHCVHCMLYAVWFSQSSYFSRGTHENRRSFHSLRCFVIGFFGYFKSIMKLLWCCARGAMMRLQYTRCRIQFCMSVYVWPLCFRWKDTQTAATEENTGRGWVSGGMSAKEQARTLVLRWKSKQTRPAT